MTLFETGILDLRGDGELIYFTSKLSSPSALISGVSLISAVFTYVVELNILIRTRQRVTNSTILAGTMSGGMKKETSTL